MILGCYRLALVVLRGLQGDHAMPSFRPPSVVVRPLASPAEHEIYFQLAKLPEWQVRWQRSLSHWLGSVSLIVGEEAYRLYIDGSQLRLADKPGNTADAIRLTPQTLVQILFGYRPVVWALQQSGQTIPDNLLSILNVLFPLGHTWIPASDWF